MADRNSATAMEIQIPLRPKIIGKTVMQIIWNTKVRIKDTDAETAPLLKAVKKADVNSGIPPAKNKNAYILKPWVVSAVRASS